MLVSGRRGTCNGCMWFTSFSVRHLGCAQQDNLPSPKVREMMLLALLRPQALIHSQCSLNLIPHQALPEPHSPVFHHRSTHSTACAGLGHGPCPHRDVPRVCATDTAPTAAHSHLSLPVMPRSPDSMIQPGTAQAGAHPAGPMGFPFPPADSSGFKLLLSCFPYPAVEVLLHRSEL